MRINGIPVVVSKYLCVFATDKQRRSHHRSRINKKWAKRYGFHEASCRGRAYQYSAAMIVCPHVKKQMDEQLN